MFVGEEDASKKQCSDKKFKEEEKNEAAADDRYMQEAC